MSPDSKVPHVSIILPASTSADGLPEAMEDPVFRTYQLDLIRHNLCDAREGCPVVMGRRTREPEYGQTRKPVPYL